MSRHTGPRADLAECFVEHICASVNADYVLERSETIQRIRAFLQELRKSPSVFPEMELLWEDQSLLAAHPSGNASSSISRELPPREIAERAAQELRLKNERLKSLATQERRASAREAQRYDQLLAQHRELQATLAEMQAQLKERAQANDALQNVLIARLDARLRMFESYEGVVKHADKDQVVVVYEVEDDLVEQTYVAKQFIAGELPKPGDCLAVSVQVVQIPEVPASHDVQDPLDEDDDHDVVPLPREF